MFRHSLYAESLPSNIELVKSIRNRAASLMLVAGMLASSSASATLFSMDLFTVELNGSTIFTDGFDDGVLPPSSPDVYSYFVFGDFTAETDSRLFSDPSTGTDSETPTGIPSKIQSARLQTPTDPAETATLGSDDTFTVSGVYDLINPGAGSEAYRVGITDRVGPTGEGDTTNDNLRLSVDRAVSGEYAGQTVISLLNLDFEADTVTILHRIPVDFTGNPDQIKLNLTKSDSSSGIITASFEYLKNGATIGGGVLGSTPDAFAAFDGEDFTRAEFTSFLIPGVAAPVNVAQLVTGSPVSLSQIVSTPATSFNLEFDYLFETLTGELQVLLDGSLLGTLSAPAVLGVEFQTASFLVDGSLLNLSDVTLEFLFDGPTNSRILLDNIVFPDLANGDFQSGNLSAFTVSGEGSAGVITLAAVPEPGTLIMLALGLGGFGIARRKKAKD